MASYTGELISCSHCQYEKLHNADNFRTCVEKRNGKIYEYIKRKCRPCEIGARVEYYRRNHITEKYKRRQKHNYARHRNQALKSIYGIDSAQFNEMLASQNFKCAICGTEKDEKHHYGRQSPLQVDHCHKTGLVRGLLCGSCNRGLGDFKDSIAALENAIAYLKRSQR